MRTEWSSCRTGDDVRTARKWQDQEWRLSDIGRACRTRRNGTENDEEEQTRKRAGAIHYLNSVDDEMCRHSHHHLIGV